MSEYRKQLSALKKQLTGCNPEEFMAVGLKIKALSKTFNIAKMKSFGLDKYEDFGWVIYRAMDKLGMTGMQAIELTHKIKY